MSQIIALIGLVMNAGVAGHQAITMMENSINGIPTPEWRLFIFAVSGALTAFIAHGLSHKLT